jgi:predicted transcriptional regulator
VRAHFKVRRQSPVKGGRERAYAGLEKRLDAELDKLAAQFRCTRAFVISTALADTFGIEVDERFDKPVTPGSAPAKARQLKVESIDQRKKRAS